MSKKFWILWCPTSHRPPTVKMFTEDEAEKAAQKMVRRTGKEFVVMEAKVSFTQGTPKRITLNKKEKPGTKPERPAKEFPDGMCRADFNRGLEDLDFPHGDQ